MNDPHGLCRLLEGDVAGWPGLPETANLTFADLPPCLGRLAGRRRRWLATGVYDIERREAGLQACEAYAWWGDARVRFVDLWPAPAASVPEIRGLLPPPEATYTFREVERETWSVDAPASAEVEELVWGSRGLALVTVHTTGAGFVERIRGFSPMPSDAWISGFVLFAATPEV